jgi:glutamine amidotransferase
MCRFVAYLGRPLLINILVSQAKVSLIRQSSCATETDVKLNGDGFGLGWYNRDVSEIPAVYRSPLPAWNDMNLKNMSHQIQSSAFFAHVRAAEEGVVNQTNCHPFFYEKYLMMHNGGIGGFKKIKLALLNKLKPQFFENIRGQTDSEILFALWLSHLKDLHQTTQESMIEAWEDTLTTLKTLQDEVGSKDPTYINVMITNGEVLLGIRYSRFDNSPLTLHYSEGSAFIHHHGNCQMLPTHPGEQNHAVIVASEKLTGDTPEWKEVPAQHFIFVDHFKRVHLIPIKNL